MPKSSPEEADLLVMVSLKFPTIKMPRRLWLQWTRKSSMADKSMLRLLDHVKKFSTSNNKKERVPQEEEDISEEEEEDLEEDSEVEEEETEDSEEDEEDLEEDSEVDEEDLEEEEPLKDQTRELNPRHPCLLPIFHFLLMMQLSERSSLMQA